MSLNRIVCPDCGAGLASKAGFVIGQRLTCPKCETSFKVSAPYEEVEEETPSAPAKAPAAAKKTVRAAVEAVEDEDEDDRPKKKKKKKKRDDDEDEDGSSYRNSWIRYTILGILVTVMLVLGYFLYDKWKAQNEDAAPQVKANEAPFARPIPPPGVPGKGPGPMGKGPGFPGQAQPKIGSGGQQGPTPGLGFNPFGGPLGILTPAESEKLTAGLVQKLIGTWEGKDPEGATHRVEYRADKTFSHKVEGGSNSGTMTGTYAVAGRLGDKVLTLTRPLGSLKQVKVTFEDDELIHDTATPGQSVILRKK